LVGVACAAVCDSYRSVPDFFLVLTVWGRVLDPDSVTPVEFRLYF
jgi:hypothetical protein